MRIYSNTNLESHGKLFILADKLGCNINEALGVIHRVWYWAARNSDDGEISEMPMVAMASIHQRLDIDALYVSGFAIPDPGGLGYLNDWHKETGLLIKQTNKRRKKSLARYHDKKTEKEPAPKKAPKKPSKPRGSRQGKVVQTLREVVDKQFYRELMANFPTFKEMEAQEILSHAEAVYKAEEKKLERKAARKYVTYFFINEERRRRKLSEQNR